MLTFPLELTYQECLDQFASFKECFEQCTGINDDYTELDYASDYSSAYSSSPKLKAYLDLIGYTADANGVTIRNDAALFTASAMFDQIQTEYDDSDCPTIEHTRFGHTSQATPTWALWDLGGDDDVDYCGLQPSCLTGALIEALLAQR